MFRNDIVGVSQTKVVDILISRMSGDDDCPDPGIVILTHQSHSFRAGRARDGPSGPFISGKWDKALLKIRRPGPRPRIK